MVDNQQYDELHTVNFTVNNCEAHFYLRLNLDPVFWGRKSYLLEPDVGNKCIGIVSKRINSKCQQRRDGRL